MAYFPPLASLGLDAGVFDDRPPLFDLGLLQRCERFRRLLLAWNYLHSGLNEPFAHCGIGQSMHHRGIELVDYIPRRSFGAQSAYQGEA